MRSAPQPARARTDIRNYNLVNQIVLCSHGSDLSSSPTGPPRSTTPSPMTARAKRPQLAEQPSTTELAVRSEAAECEASEPSR